MEAYLPVGLVTVVACIVLFVMAAAVARTRIAVGILPPAMTGDPLLERTIRAHSNTLEWMPVFLPALWLFAIYGNPVWASVLGAVWIVGRIVYFIGYRIAPEKRRIGFGIQAMAAFILVIGAGWRIVYLMVTLRGA
ncbi:MAPEG family protein [Bordetella bronchialis]|uniref:MAPEG family protein n=1 Tax=Bordetella bronchialis TaxID=463025 RepID=A0A193FE82_9BORD|nr:MAPEG family protein [Bordetella bronchialis]ANN65454.1 hypothetical protein BAU06_03300 [Bordetella bronchialis]ANN70484.1 hypothetical protein BAU08_03265 [Bordetella bronchialis]